MWLWSIAVMVEHCDCAHLPPPSGASGTKYARLPSTTNSSSSDHQPVINNQSTRLDCHSMSSVNASEFQCDTLWEMIITCLCSNRSMPIVDSGPSLSKQFNNLQILGLISHTNVTWVDLCLMNRRIESSSSKQTAAKFELNQVFRRATVNYNRINIVNDHHHHDHDSEPNEFQRKRDPPTTPPVPMAGNNLFGTNQKQNLPGPGTSKRCIGLASCSQPNQATGPLAAASNDNQSQAIVKFCLLVTVANCSRSAGTTNQTQPNRDSSCYNAARATINQTSTRSSSHTQNIALLQSCQLQSFRAHNTHNSSDSMQPVHCPLSSLLASRHNCNLLATLMNSTSAAGKCRLVPTNGTKCIHWLSSEQFNHSCLSIPPMSGFSSKRPLGNVILILSKIPEHEGSCLLGFVVECTRKCDLNGNDGGESSSAPVQSVAGQAPGNHINMLIESLNQPFADGQQSMTNQGKPKRSGFVLNKSIVLATSPMPSNRNDQKQSEAPTSSESGGPEKRTVDSMAPLSSSFSSSPPPSDTVRHVYSGESMVHHQHLEWPSPTPDPNSRGPNSLFNQILDVASDRAVSGGVNGAEPKQLNTDTTATKSDQFTRNQTTGWNVNNNNNRGSNYHNGAKIDAKPVRCLHHHLNQSDPHSSLFDIINFNQFALNPVDRPPILGLHANHDHASLTQASVHPMPVPEALVASPSLAQEPSENMSEFSQLSGLVLSRDPDRSTLLSRFPSLKLPPPPPEFADEFNEGKAHCGHWPFG